MNISNVTVLTASLPERASMLAECCATIADQTVTPAAHFVGIDHAHAGGGATRSRLLAAVDTEWVSVIDDDDLADPDHIATQLEHARDDLDVVYTWCRVTGPDAIAVPLPPFLDDRDLADGNWIPATALIRTEAARAAGGWPPVPLADWSLWLAMLDRGSRFRCVERETWTYRFHPGQTPRVAA